MVFIVADRREDHSIFEVLRELGADVKEEQLEIGDFVLSSRVVCERKTRTDFEDSIVDGRVFRQIKALKEAYPCVLVIVEGKRNEEGENRISRKALLGAYASLAVDFGISLFFTKDQQSTAEFLYAVAKYEQEGKKAPLPVCAKKKMLTLEEYQRAVIESLPKIGPKLARSILDQFGSIKSVVNASEKELWAVKGLGKKRARMIMEVLTWERK
ncbi:MAG: ERCC4 domain-containing protein, partial [Candidatus Anstonellales archaeon]